MKSKTSGRLVVQPRLGVCQPDRMRAALQAIRGSGANCIGTITVDSHTRQGDYGAVERHLGEGRELNGYPVLHFRPEVTRAMIEGLQDGRFPIQVRHGTPDPRDIFRRLPQAGLDATEGGPISYCLPYGRTPLALSVNSWREACEELASNTPACHLESFGGCMMGQLCPPSMLLAITLLECLFFRACGIGSLSLSYAQGPSMAQDRAALKVLRGMAASLLDGSDWHVVIYTYMGLFPATPEGAMSIIADSARLARDAGCERLIVKTVAERRQIPSVTENVTALRLAEEAYCRRQPSGPDPLEGAMYLQILHETRSLLDAVLNLDNDIGEAILEAFRLGILDVPYCLHPDNPGRARAGIGRDGALHWGDIGSLPFEHLDSREFEGMTSDGLLAQLGLVSNRYDRVSDGFWR